jgi:hypothetical protein
MTSEEKIGYIRGFIQRLQEIVATADVGDDCKRALPRFHNCEQNLISFLGDAGFHNDASIVAANANHIPATYGAPLIDSIQEDVEFYCGKLDAILEDLLHPIYTPNSKQSVPQPSLDLRTSASDIMIRPIDIFFSYAHEDEALMDEVRRQLIGYDRRGIIRKWHDRQIAPGSNWRGQIDERLFRSDIILLFITPHFIESRYCYDVEMAEALRRHDANTARVIPVILRPCLWQDEPFARLQPVPTGGKPLTTWPNRDEGALNAAQGIMSVVRELIEKHPAPNEAA